jgi:hypothetical protein
MMLGLIAEEQMELQIEDCQEEEREQRFLGEHVGTGKTCALSTVTS